jgi:mRNA-degrading endonuclease toxin of MazEF toxin-antitoxin module
MPLPCALSLDNLTTMPQGFLVERVRRLDIAKMAAVRRTLRVATGCG